MVQKLDALPRKGAKYWTDVDADIKLHIPHLKRCTHEFAQVSANELECKKCHVGFIVTPDFKLKDGHIYKDDKLII